MSEPRIFPLPPGLQAGQLLWFDTQRPGEPIERRFVVVTRDDIARGSIPYERFEQLVKELKPGDVAITSNSTDLRALTGNMEPAKVLDSVRERPRHEGHVGRYWRCNLEELRRRYGKGQEDATLAAWVLEAPWAHPVWHSYVVILVHLRPLADGRETITYREGATHEFWLYALDPNAPRDKMVRGRESPLRYALTPVNFGAQIIEPSDSGAMGRIEQALDDVCAGALSPDSDFTAAWAARFGDNMLKRGWKFT